MTNHEIVKKLIGKINPIGESNTDAERYENLINTIALVESLIMDIQDVVYYNKNAYERSKIAAKDLAQDFLDRYEIKS